MVKSNHKDPTAELVKYQIQNRPGRSYFNQPFRAFESGDPAAEPDTAPAPWVPVVEVFEEADNVRVVAELPGVMAKDLNVALEGNRLTISGSKPRAEEEPAVKVHRHERTYGQFKRVFKLRSVIDFQNLTATFERGVLTVTLPKAESAKRHQIPITG